jgi:hypothetical protein
MKSLYSRYLTGNQLSGESSIEGYIDALKRGCRCVECEYASFIAIGIPFLGLGFPVMDTQNTIYFLVLKVFTRIAGFQGFVCHLIF